MKDQGRRHPDHLMVDFQADDLPDPETHDPLMWDKLQRALDFLGPRARCRPGSTHRYTDSNGANTAP